MKLPKIIDDNLPILTTIGIGVVLLLILTKKKKSQYDKDCGCSDKVLLKDITDPRHRELVEKSGKGFICSFTEPKSQADCKPGCKFKFGRSSDGMMQVYTPNGCVKDENY